MEEIKPKFDLQKLLNLKPTLAWVRTHRPVVIFVAIVGILISAFFIQEVYFRIRAQYAVYDNEFDQKRLRDERNKEYAKLLKEQEDRKRTSRVDESELESRKFIGKQVINFVLVKPPTLAISEIQPLIDKLKDNRDRIYSDCDLSSDCPKNVSLNYLKRFYSDQAKEYEVSDLDVEIKIHGAYDLVDLEKIGDIGNIWGKDAFGIIRLQDTFETVLKSNNLNFKDQEMQVFLYFDNSFDEVSGNTDRFYEHKKFRSFAEDDYGKAYINVYRFEKDFSRIMTEVAGHEILHLYGASDKYEESISVSRICSERGQGDLEQRPRVPQSTSDIMCGYIELDDDEFKRADLTKETIVINSLTAQEIGWRDKED